MTGPQKPSGDQNPSGAKCLDGNGIPVAERKPFLLRVDPALLEALQRWANDDLRSLNGQIEFVLRRAAQQAGRLKESGRPAEPSKVLIPPVDPAILPPAPNLSNCPTPIRRH